MNISSYKNSRFLTKADVTPEALVTITEITDENVAPPNEPVKKKPCLHFKELDKPFVCNYTNLEVIAELLGSDETDDWVGNPIVLYYDPNVMFGGKRVGGIRVKMAPKFESAYAKAKAAMAEDDGDEVPF